VTVRVVLANDSDLVLRGLEAMLDSYAERIDVRGRVTGDPDIVDLPHDGRDIDVLLLDTYARSAAGLDALAMLLSQAPPFKVVAFTDSQDERHVLKALRLGVDGYVLKSTSAADLVRALERIAAGETVVTESVATDAARYAARSPGDEPWPGARLGLTNRESDVLTLVAGGTTPLDIARKLAIAPETVRSHLKRIYQKLGVNDRTAAAAIAWQEGMVEREPIDPAT
jgi:DNA-binding NarL/FixJ family response regulator